MNASKPELVVPEFNMPLSPEELGQLGLFNAIWSQIDFLVTILMAHLSKTEIATVITMTGSATTAPRIAMLKKFADAADPRLAETCRSMGKLIGARNHLSHGVWGLHWAADGSANPGCYFALNKDKPIMASQLPQLIADVTEASSALGSHWRRLSPMTSGGPRPRMFLFGEGPPDPKAPPTKRT